MAYLSAPLVEFPRTILDFPVQLYLHQRRFFYRLRLARPITKRLVFHLFENANNPFFKLSNQLLWREIFTNYLQLGMGWLSSEREIRYY